MVADRERNRIWSRSRVQQQKGVQTRTVAQRDGSSGGRSGGGRRFDETKRSKGRDVADVLRTQGEKLTAEERIQDDRDVAIRAAEREKRRCREEGKGSSQRCGPGVGLGSSEEATGEREGLEDTMRSRKRTRTRLTGG
jgi:hypothetical protein